MSLDYEVTIRPLALDSCGVVAPAQSTARLLVAAVGRVGSRLAAFLAAGQLGSLSAVEHGRSTGARC